MMPNETANCIKKIYDLNLNDDDMRGFTFYASDLKTPNKSKYLHGEGYGITDMFFMIILDDMRITYDKTKSNKGIKKTLFSKFWDILILDKNDNEL